MPSLAVLRPGVVTVYEQNKKSKYFGRENVVSEVVPCLMSRSVSSGTVTVLDDASVQIVAEEAAAVEDLDPQVSLDCVA